MLLWLFLLSKSEEGLCCQESELDKLSPKLGIFLVHFSLCCNVWRYSVCHLLQRCWVIGCTTCQCLRWFIRVWLKLDSGKEIIHLPNRNWLGVNTSSSNGSVDNRYNGLEFNMASTRRDKVWNYFKVKILLPITLFSRALALLIPISHIPLWCGADGGMKWNFM